MTNEEIVVALQHLVGTRYVPSVKEYIAELTGRARIVGVGEFATREMDVNRVHIRSEDGVTISGFDFN